MAPLDLRSHERLRFLVDATPDLVLVIDEHGTILFAGEEASEVLAEPGSTMEGRSFFELLHPDDRAALPKTALGLCTDKADGTTHWEARLLAGSNRWINFAGRDRRVDGLEVILFVRDISDKKQADHEAWLLRRAVDAVNNLVVIADARQPDQPLIFVNDFFLDTTGYTREEIIGRNCRFLQQRPDGTRDGDQPGRWALKDGVRYGDHVSTLIRNYRKDGTLFWNELYVSPLRNADGEITHFVGVQNDVTERERARQDLEARERLLRSFYDSAPVMMGVAELVDDPSNGDEVVYRFVNRASTEIFDRTPEAVTGQSARQLGFTEAEADIWARHYLDSLETGAPVRFETSFPWESDPEGEGVRTLTVVVNYLGAEDGARRFSFIADDVTERRRVERARRLLEAAVENTAEPLLITTTDLEAPGPTIIYVNPAFAQMAGYERDELIGQTPRVLQGPRTDRSLLDRLRRQLIAERPFRGETVNYRKDGSEYIVEWEITAIRDENGVLTHWVSNQRDVTERRLLEHQVLDAAARAQERIGQDLHDSLGQLLTGTSFLAQTLQQRLENAGRPEAEDARRVSELLGDGISQARVLARTLHPVDIDAGGVLTALQRLADSVREVYEIDCSFESVARTGALTGQRGVDLYRIAQEAVTNAIRHGRARAIRLRLLRFEDIMDGTDEMAAPQDLVLIIEDNGAGISDEELEQSRGMGLHNMRYRARRLGGELRIRRRQEGGTVVRCRFDPTAEPVPDVAEV